MAFQAPRGTSDIMPDDQPLWRMLEAKASDLASRYGYSRIDTPVFESSELFVRSIGTSTDILEKETYTFQDRGGDSLTLRPEGTAPVCRAYLEHGLHNNPQPTKLYYICQNFRYERPQSGRFRAFHQFGVEIFGESSSFADAEVIELAWTFLAEVGLTELSLTINSIGDQNCRPKYVSELQLHYRETEYELCNDCDRRLQHNPLRLLDCKAESCQQMVLNAPKSIDYLCGECEDHWSTMLDYLSNIGLSYQVDNRLVRGLDYYTKTVFEIAPPLDGRMNVIAGGGRYDGLIDRMGGPETAGIGFGMGLERVIDNLARQSVPTPTDGQIKVLIAHIGSRAEMEAAKLASGIRGNGTTAVLGPSRGLRSQLRYASSIGADYVIIIGENEIASGKYTFRCLSDSTQSEKSHRDILTFFSSIGESK